MRQLHREIRESLLRVMCHGLAEAHCHVCDGACELLFNPLLDPGPELFRGASARTRIATDVTNRSITDLNFNLPALKPFGHGPDGQQVNFIDTALDATDREEILAIEPFLDQLFIK